MSLSYGIKASLKGTDVEVVTDREATFTSKLVTQKVYKWNTFSFTTDGNGDYTLAIPHDLDYAPAFDVFLTGTAAFSLIEPTTYPNAWFSVGGGNRWFGQDQMGGVFADSDADNLYIHVRDGFKSTALTGKYYLYIDKIEAFGGVSGIGVSGDIGMKVSSEGQSVFDGEEYNMAFSTRYKTMQYYQESIKEANLTLPLMFASYGDQDVEEATYVDFNHGLGYAPKFDVFFKTGSILKGAPYMENDIAYDSGAGYFTDPVYEVSAWSDSTRIRVTFWRRSRWLTPDFEPNVTHVAQTITVRVLPYAENLAGLNNG